jgi:hypothetical protein
MSVIHNKKQPRQRLPYSKKTKSWRKDNVDAADKFSFYHNEVVRQTLKNKIINLNLYNGIVDIRDLHNTVNPHQIDASFIPDNIPHHPVMNAKVDLLIGEEINRRFDYKVLVTNHDAISTKEEELKKELKQKMISYFERNYSKEELEEKYKELEDFLKYDYQDIRERLATQILQHYSSEQNFKRTFNNGFKDALIMAEEIYQIDIVSNEPELKKLNPLKVHCVRSGKSEKIEDSDLIILEDHWNPGRIVDTFYEELKPDDIDYIMDYSTKRTNNSYTDDDNNHVLLRDGYVGHGGGPAGGLDAMFNLAEVNGHYFGSDYTDENGNIRVIRVYWKSLKKIKKVKYYDEFGDVEYKYRSEEYIEDKTRGEESKNLWVNEWWEGTKLGKDIYIQMKPKKVQYNKVSNPSFCSPGIIGEVYNTNQGRAVSLVDKMKNYQYLYDVIWDRTNKSIATNYGKIFELDLAKVPDNWEIEKWMHFAVTNKIAVVDSFKEGNKGASTGKLAGGMNTVGGRAIDMETGNYIQQHMQLLEFIKLEMGEIAGVSRQREGQISNRETVGGVERSVNQSAHITEYWFSKHDDVKIRVLTAFLETAKIALKNNKKKTQFILDDQTTKLLDLSDDSISEADYGLTLTSGTKATELEQSMKQYAQAFIQKGGPLSVITDIYFSGSISEMRKKLEKAENKMNKQNQQQQEQANKIKQQELQQQAQKEQKEQERADRELNIKDNISKRQEETKRYVANLKNSDDGVADPINEKKLELDYEKLKNNKLEQIKELEAKMTMHKDKMQREDKKIAMQKKNKSSK